MIWNFFQRAVQAFNWIDVVHPETLLMAIVLIYISGIHPRPEGAWFLPVLIPVSAGIHGGYSVSMVVLEIDRQKNQTE